MPTCRCKMCGGQIQYELDASVATCEFCNTEQTIVKTDDVKQLKLFSRANTLRLQNEFDKAQTTYENILIDDPNNAEAHWGICLCRYGIEYVDDEKAKKKVPTCHRTVYKYIYDDLDYIETINNADVVAKKVYEREAKIIDSIQKNILEISQKEDPYDIFICYKETDDNGDRTPDSVKAQDIYNELIKQGYKVFFSRISLESKIGTNYEPIIFAALMSSKIMLAVGSCPEYYNSPWVKNEWGRFLSFMNDVQGKHLIPCYFNMDAYELPEEFLMLQAQDISKIGYMQDLTRGIKKLMSVHKKEIETPNVEIILSKQEESRLNSIFRRVKLYVESEEFDRADTLLEEVLNIKSDYAEAYFYKVLINRKAKNVEDLINKGELIDDNNDYNRALRFADADFKEFLVNLNENIKKSSIYIEKTKEYDKAVNYYEWKKYSLAYSTFKKISPFLDSDEYANKCCKEIYKDACKILDNENDPSKLETAANMFYLIIDYKDSSDKYSLANDKSLEIKVNKLIRELEGSMNRLQNTNFRNYEHEKSICSKCLDDLEYLAKKYDIKIGEYEKKYRDRFNQMVAEYNSKRKVDKSGVIAAAIILGIIIIVAIILSNQGGN